ncbi:MAG: PadR family transcriptional regulator [Nocardioides sp.]
MNHRYGRSAWGEDWSGDWPGGDRGGRRPGDRGQQHQGPPPWLAGLFGLVQGDGGRARRVRRGDVRAAILDVVATEPLNGYQVIQQIAERSGGSWRPSPGSVYPTIAQLTDEGLITSDESSGPRSLRLTPAGEEYVAAHLEELGSVWSAFARPSDAPDYQAMKADIGALMSAVWQIATQGTDRQRQEGIEVLTETRRQLYRILATDEPSGGDDAAV